MYLSLYIYISVRIYLLPKRLIYSILFRRYLVIASNIAFSQSERGIIFSAFSDWRLIRLLPVTLDSGLQTLSRDCIDHIKEHRRQEYCICSLGKYVKVV